MTAVVEVDFELAGIERRARELDDPTLVGAMIVLLSTLESKGEPMAADWNGRKVARVVFHEIMLRWVPVDVIEGATAKLGLDELEYAS